MKHSSSASSLPPSLEPKPSRRLLQTLGLAYALAFIALLFSGVPLSIKLVLVVLILASAVWHWRKFARIKSSTYLREVTFRNDDTCVFEYGDGREWSGELKGALVTTKLVIIHCRKGWQRRSGVIMPDSLERDHFRRLRVYLNTHVWVEPYEDV